MIIKKVFVDAGYVREQIKKAILKDESISEQFADLFFNDDLPYTEFMSQDWSDDVFFEGAIDRLEALGIIEYSKAVIEPLYELGELELQNKPTKKDLQELLIKLLEEQAQTNHYLRLLVAENKRKSNFKVVE